MLVLSIKHFPVSRFENREKLEGTDHADERQTRASAGDLRRDD
jgi:hypothetical protein